MAKTKKRNWKLRPVTWTPEGNNTLNGFIAGRLLVSIKTLEARTQVPGLFAHSSTTTCEIAEHFGPRAKFIRVEVVDADDAKMQAIEGLESLFAELVE